MRQPLKRMHIYEDLKRSISAGVYHQGAFLPNELILAEKYGVARETLRSVLKLLEEDMLIERIRSRGTRVCGSIQAPLTFLSPCPDFFYGGKKSLCLFAGTCLPCRTLHRRDRIQSVS